jgi:integrase
MAKLTVRAIEAAKPKDKPYKLTVDKGLYLRVGTNNEKRWIVRYVVNRKQREARLPAPYGNGDGFLSLAQAIAENARIQALARDNIDYQERLKEQHAEAVRHRTLEEMHNLTVQDLFDVWVTDGVARQNGNAELMRLFSKDVLPQLGDKQLRLLTDKDVLAMLRRMLKRGVTRLTVLAYRDLSQMLAWGEKRQPWRGLLVDGNPCDLIDINKLLPDDYEEERDRVLNDDEIRELSAIFATTLTQWESAPDRRSAPRPVARKTQIALWLCLSTLCRIGELLMARWDHVDLEKGVWFIPRENVKGRRGKKQEHYIFMSDFARRQFVELREITGHSEWCFPSKNKTGEETHVCLKSVSKQVGDRQIRFKNRKPLKSRVYDDSLVLSNGMNGEWTPHDLRRTGATMMQALGVSLDVIDRCQNHVLAGGRVRRHYLHHDYREEKTEAWKRLGHRLDAILAQQAERRLELLTVEGTPDQCLERLFEHRLKLRT